MATRKHVHLIGICGTAMASLAGMLAERGFRVTGSDAAAYPPMSDFLQSLGIPISQPFAAENLQPAPDLVVIGNAISRGNVELEHVLDRRIPFCSLPQLLHDEFLRGKEEIHHAAVAEASRTGCAGRVRAPVRRCRERWRCR